MKVLCILLILPLGLAARADVLATVGRNKITREELDRKFSEVRKQSLNPPTRDQFLEDLIRFELGVQEAEKMGLQNDPSVRERVRQLLYNALLEKKLGQRIEGIKVTDSEMRSEYKKNPEVRLEHFLAEVKPGAAPIDRELARKQAVELAEDAKKPNSHFSETANDLGFQSRLTLPPEIYAIARGMKPGEVRGPIETSFGFHVIKLIERRSYDLADKTLIHAVLTDEKRRQIFDEYFKKLRKQYQVSVAPVAPKASTN